MTKKVSDHASPWKSVLAKDMDEYLAAVPEWTRVGLENLRQTIKAIVPEAVETIYHRIPTFDYYGPLVGFSATKNQCSLHIMSPAVAKAFKAELKRYPTGTDTVHFPAAKPLPPTLVEKIVRARMKENESRVKKQAPGEE